MRNGSQDMFAPMTRHFGGDGYSPVRQQIVPGLNALRDAAVQDADYEGDDCICAKSTCDECNPGEGGQIGRPNDVFHDNVKKNQLQHCHDTMQACWNAWDAACKFEDGPQAAYYLDLLTLTQQYQKRLLNLKKKNY